MTPGQVNGRCLTTYDAGDDRVSMLLSRVERSAEGLLLNFPDEDLSPRVP